MIELRAEASGDAESILKLLQLSFGPDRYRKTVYRLREGVLPLRSLCFVAEYVGELRGSLRFWPVVIYNPEKESYHFTLLLGPLAVDPGVRGCGAGVALMNEGLTRARELGYERVILVGDPEYYGRFGFVAEFAWNLRLPGPVHQKQFLAKELVSGAFSGVSGLVQPVLHSHMVPADTEDGSSRKASNIY